MPTRATRTDPDDIITLPLLRGQLGLFHPNELPEPERAYRSATEIELHTYDTIIVSLSGGKDSIAALLHLLDHGVPKHRIELWHHAVDGREGSTLFDWPFMESFNHELARALNVPMYFSWIDGGLEGELMKRDAISRPITTETPDGLVRIARDERRSTPATRRRFPQQSANLAVRWCSSVAKIDVARRALTTQARFLDRRTLFITGERAEESPNRARYAQFEPHASHRAGPRVQRHIDAWRPVLHWSEERVWDALERWRIEPPVPYRLGWSRSSCQTCVFNSPTLWATLQRYFPERLEPIHALEREFGVTIHRSGAPISTIAAQHAPLEIRDAAALEQATRSTYSLPIRTPESSAWRLPPGAFGRDTAGPT